MQNSRQQPRCSVTPREGLAYIQGPVARERKQVLSLSAQSDHHCLLRNQLSATSFPSRMERPSAMSVTIPRKTRTSISLLQIENQ